MGFVKSFSRRPAVQGAFAWVASGHVRLVRATTRWRAIRSAAAAAAWAGEAPIIVAFWHNRLLMMPYCWPSPQPFHMLISAHPDGRLISRTVGHLGISTIAGSSRRGGGEALRLLVRKLQQRESVGITPDGPRGPRLHAGDGPIALARLSGIPIVPAAASVSNRIVLNTWDRLIVALPFGRGATVWGDPLVVPRDASPDDLAGYRARLETELRRVTDRADEMAGVAPITAEETAHEAA